MHFYKKSVRIPTVFQHCVRAFLLCSSTLSKCIALSKKVCSSIGYVHFHCSGRLSGLFWTASGLLNVLGSFLDCFRLLLGSIHCSMRVNLVFCLHKQKTRCVHSYCIPALCACFSIVNQHFLCVHFYCFQHCLHVFFVVFYLLACFLFRLL